jgi:hypothetical protein
MHVDHAVESGQEARSKPGKIDNNLAVSIQLPESVDYRIRPALVTCGQKPPGRGFDAFVHMPLHVRASSYRPLEQTLGGEIGQGFAQRFGVHPKLSSQHAFAGQLATQNAGFDGLPQSLAQPLELVAQSRRTIGRLGDSFFGVLFHTSSGLAVVLNSG